MKTGNLSTPVSITGLPGLKFSIYPGLVLLAIIALASVGGCRPAPAASEPFTPPYLRLTLCGGDAEVQQPGDTGWRMAGDEIRIEERVRLQADAAEGARFCLGDDSVLELAPAAQVVLENPRILPRLQIRLDGGSLQFVAQKPSYAFLLPGCSLTVATTPARVTVEMTAGEAHFMVDEGALTCSSEAGTVTLIRCQDLRASEGAVPQFGRFCEATPVPTVATQSSTLEPPSRTAGPTATPTVTATPSPTATSTPRAQAPRPTATLAPPTPTDTPTSPPPPPPPPATSPPQPRPTNTPAPQPTDTPLPPPTEPPPTIPPPTDTPRPPPTPPAPRPTPTP